MKNKIIGYTSTNKAIYFNRVKNNDMNSLLKEANYYEDFTNDEHLEAARMHLKMPTNRKTEQHHVEQANFHYLIAEGKLILR